MLSRSIASRYLVSAAVVIVAARCRVGRFRFFSRDLVRLGVLNFRRSVQSLQSEGFVEADLASAIAFENGNRIALCLADFYGVALILPGILSLVLIHSFRRCGCDTALRGYRPT